MTNSRVVFRRSAGRLHSPIILSRIFWFLVELASVFAGTIYGTEIKVISEVISNHILG